MVGLTVVVGCVDSGHDGGSVGDGDDGVGSIDEVYVIKA